MIKKNSETSLLDQRSKATDGRFTEVCARPASLKREVRSTNLAERTLKGQESVTLLGGNPRSPAPFSCNSVTFHYLKRSDYSRSFTTRSQIKAQFSFVLFGM